MMRTTVPQHNPYIDLFVREHGHFRYVGQTQWAKSPAEARRKLAEATNRALEDCKAVKHKEDA